jgi:hypothetical protein
MNMSVIKEQLKHILIKLYIIFRYDVPQYQ